MTTTLEKLTITPLVRQKDRFQRLPSIPVLFNPETYSISKSVSWQAQATVDKANAPLLSFEGGSDRELSLELMFDVSFPVTRNGQAIAVQDVREETNKLLALTRIQGNESHPRVCEIAWGKAPIGSDFPFTGVITSLTQTFNLFSRDGKPIRAKLNVTFKEFSDPTLKPTRSTPALTIQVASGGSTISSIATEHYQDPKLWRQIAEANGIDDPRNLSIGKVLTIPRKR